ncbi:MAG TPA: PKD domain-containing protein, partial [Candidatus Pacearchaeota archaeon]|nr:PKD domain-containing protein [Candidatus Pacearchaeota archaeon]
LSANAGDDVISTTGTEITFDASASTGNIEEYYWNFGDGQTKTGKVVTHKYQYPGEYLVYLRVSNGEEKNTNSIQVQIFSSEIFISEFLPNPKGNDSNQEWIEIVNESKEVQNITGWGIGNKAEKATFVFPEGTYLTPNGLLLLSSSLTKISLLNDAGSLFLFYPSGDLCQEVKYENPGENVSIARENGDYFYTQNPTPGMKNIISNHSSENKISSLSQAQIQNQTQNPSSASNFISVSAFTPSNSVLNSTNFSNSINSSSNSNNDDDDSNSSSILNQNSSTILGSSSEKNKNNENVEKEKDSLLSSFLTSDLLVKVKGNKNKIILAIMGVVLCSGFLAIYLVRLRRKIKEKSDNSINNTNLEKIEVEIEK